MSDLPDAFDYVVWGTGLTECILSAALTRAGHSVLHLDSCQQYGGAWQSPSLRDLESQLEAVAPGARLAWGCGPPEIEAWRARSRHFCLDLSPRLCFCRSAAVSDLLQSDVSRYLEFLPISGLYTVDESGGLERAPVQRGQLFRSSRFSLVEKLHCGRFAEFCATCRPAELPEAELPFPELLARHQLRSGPALRLFGLAVAMSPPDAPAAEVVARIQRFLASCGAYGPSPLLVPKFGASEICQAFSRHAAVWGAVFHLGADPTRPPAAARRRIVMSDRFAEAAWLDRSLGRRLLRQILVTDRPWAPQSEDQQDTDEVRIAVCMLPGFSRPMLGLELTPETGCCPPGSRLVHLMQPCGPGDSVELRPDTCVHCALAPFTRLRFQGLPNSCSCQGQASDPAGQASDPVGQASDPAGQASDPAGQASDPAGQASDPVGQPSDPAGQASDPAGQASASEPYRLPRCILSICFSQEELSDCQITGSAPDNVTIVPSLYSDFDLDAAFLRAKAVFADLCPGQEFLPKPPDQEDLVFEPPAGSEHQPHLVNGDDSPGVALPDDQAGEAAAAVSGGGGDGAGPSGPAASNGRPEVNGGSGTEAADSGAVRS